MPKSPSLFFVFRKEVFSFSAFITIICLTLGYIFLLLFLLNNRLVISIVNQPIPLNNKVVILFSLIGGLFTAFSPLDSIFVIIGSLLVGLNVIFIVKTFSFIKNARKIRLSVGGASILGLVTAGCGSCGFSVLSIIGLGSTLSFLPFRGLGLQILSLLLLIISFFYMLSMLRESVYCKRKT